MSGCQLLLQELLKSFWWSQFLSLVGTLTNYQWHIYTSIGIPWQPRCWETYLSNNLYKKQKFTIWLFELNAGKSSFVWTTKDWDFCLIQQSSQCKNVPLHITVKFSLSWKVCCFLRRSEQTLVPWHYEFSLEKSQPNSPETLYLKCSFPKGLYIS